MPEYDTRSLSHIYLPGHGESESFTSPLSRAHKEDGPLAEQGPYTSGEIIGHSPKILWRRQGQICAAEETVTMSSLQATPEL